MLMPVFIASMLTVQATEPISLNQEKPNIIIILTDDMGWTDLGCYGSKKNSTPHIDKMANEGIRFTQAYAAASVCTPSRAALLTGRYPHEVGLGGAALWYNARNGLDTQFKTLSSTLNSHGYATGCFGKWHLGQMKKFMPNAHGFNSFEGIPYSNSMWSLRNDGSKEKFPPLPYYRNQQQIDVIDSHEKMNNLTQRITQSAIQFIDENAKAKTPFFLYLAHPQPHVPIACSKPFQGKSKNGLYGDVIEELDSSTGDIFNALKRNHLDSNTLVVFTSDNGPWLNYGNHSGESVGLREGKMTVFEGGFRVPFIVWYPSKFQQNKVDTGIISHIDLFSTLMTFSGASVPVGVRGVNMIPYWQGETNTSPRHSFTYYDNTHKRAILNGEIKTIYPHVSRSYQDCPTGINGKAGKMKSKKIPYSQFNLSDDLGETRNLFNDKKGYQNGFIN